MATEKLKAQGFDLLDRGVDQNGDHLPGQSTGVIEITFDPEAGFPWATKVTRIDEEEL